MKRIAIEAIVLICMCTAVAFVTPAFAQISTPPSVGYTTVQRDTLIKQLLQQVMVLQKLLAQLQSQQSVTTTTSSGEWQSSPNIVVNNKGPQKNVMSCKNGADTSLANGALACYGLHAYGGEFGNELENCGGLDPDYEKRIPTGCVIPAPACKTNRAIATDYYLMSGASAQKISELAKNLQATKAAVHDQVIRVWEYRCTDKPVTGLSSVIDQSKIEQYDGSNSDWDFVDSAADVLVVGAYTGNSKDGSINVSVSSANQNSLLVLTAYDPVTWNLSGAALKNIKAVFITGYENQHITGLPKGINVTSSVYEAGQTENYFYAYERDSVEYYKLMNYLRAKTGYTPYLFFGGYQLTDVDVSIKG